MQAHAAPGAKVAVLGLSYKPDTQVVEESQGVALAGKLSEEGYVVSVYDPLAMAGAETMLSDRVIFANDASTMRFNDVQVAVVTTPWPQFKETGLWARRPPETKLVVIDPWRVVEADGASRECLIGAHGIWRGAHDRAMW